MLSKPERIIFAVLVLFAGPWISVSNAQHILAPMNVVQVTGLVGVKNNTKGTLSIENGNLRFVHSRSKCDVAASSVQDVLTGNDSQRAIRGTMGTLSMFAPYGSGRFLSLFRTRLDTLTIRYRDGEGGLHGVIFTMPVGRAELIKNELIGQGAHSSVPNQAAPNREDWSKPHDDPKEQRA